MGKRLIIFLILACGCFSLSGCYFVYKPDIKQGNILTPKKVNAIRPGMTKEQVIDLLGNPILVNAFGDNQLIYVYTIKPRHGPFRAQQLRVYFSHGRVTHYTSNVH